MFCVRFIIAVFIVAIFASSGFAQGITVKKIVLAKFKTAEDKIINLPQSSPYWPQVDYRILSMDDAGRIYLLNLWNNEILRFSKAGKLEKAIPLSIKLFRLEEYINGGLQVSGDGKHFFVEGFDQSKKIQQLVLNEKGEIERKIPYSDDIFQGFPETRVCNTPNYYLFKQGGLLYDSNFQLLKEPFSGFSDSEGRYKADNKNHVLVKYKKDGAKLWEKRFERVLGVPGISSDILGVLGVDSSNHLYLTGTFNKNDKNSLYRLDSKGRITGKALAPNPFPLLTQEEKDEWQSHDSEVPLSFYKLTCTGDVYLIFQLGQLPSLTFKRWLKGGEFYIYRFELEK